MNIYTLVCQSSLCYIWHLNGIFRRDKDASNNIIHDPLTLNVTEGKAMS